MVPEQPCFAGEASEASLVAASSVRDHLLFITWLNESQKGQMLGLKVTIPC